MLKTCMLCLAIIVAWSRGYAAETLLVGIDTKLVFDEQGKRVNRQPGRDLIQAYDLQDPSRPVLKGEIALTNSVIGPPTNLAVVPGGRIALVSNALNWTPNGRGGWDPIMDDRLFVVDLHANPLRLLATLHVGRQPSGLAVDRSGRLAIVANRGGRSVSVLAIRDNTARVAKTIDMGDEVTSVAITPDGTRALVVEFAAHKVAVLSISNGNVEKTGDVIPAGLFPYQVTVSPDGHWALVGDTGKAYSNGNADPVTVIDLRGPHPHVVDYVTAGDSVEGLVFSPRGDHAVAAILNGSYDTALDSWFRHARGRMVLLGVEHDRIVRQDVADAGQYPEGVAISPRGDFAYAGNFAGRSITVFQITAEGRLVDTGHDIPLPGPAASLRIGSE